jgi:hypothetical protein
MQTRLQGQVNEQGLRLAQQRSGQQLAVVADVALAQAAYLQGNVICRRYKDLLKMTKDERPTTNVRPSSLNLTRLRPWSV